MSSEIVDLNILCEAGEFAANKDVAAYLRETKIKPQLSSGHTIRLDFEGVTGATQSFVHALVSEVIRKNSKNLDQLIFKKCNEPVRSIVEIVVEYSQYKQVAPPAMDDIPPKK